MEKNFLAYFVFGMLFLNSCNTTGNNDSLKLICSRVWEDSAIKLVDNSVLSLSLYKKTNSAVFYWVSFEKRPVGVRSGLEKSIRYVDDKSIFWDKSVDSLNDYNFLIRKGIIYLTNPTGIDDSLGGRYMYISRIDDNSQYDIVPMVNFFIIVHEFDKINDQKTNIVPDLSFDQAADSILQN